MTTAIDLIRRLHQHRAWVNGNLLTAAGELTDEQLRQSFAIGQGSVWNSLVHMQAAEYVWLESLLGDPSPLFPGDVAGKLPGNQLGQGGIATLEELRSRWLALETRWLEYLRDLTPEALEVPVKKITSTSPGKVWTNRRTDVLLHVCTHAHYTVAQVVNMLRQLGVQKMPDTMVIALARLEG